MKRMCWEWNEFQQIGTDYASVDEVAAYDSRMRMMRDVDAENRAILKLLNLPENGSVLEIGTGTGAFLRAAAKVCGSCVGLDVSPVMLEYAERRAREENLLNIRFVQGGFLSGEYPENGFDGVVSGLALHHLPDLWKAVALRRIRSALKPGGRFVLLDVVFDWKSESPEAYFERLVKERDSSRENFIRHIAQEYSTLDWIMKGLFEHAGFVLESESVQMDFLRLYCVRKAEAVPQ